jgi:ABC-type arginine transport system ATPase subunit
MKKTNVIAATLLATSAATASSQTINVNDIELTTSGEIKYHGELGEFDRKYQDKKIKTLGICTLNNSCDC